MAERQQDRDGDDLRQPPEQQWWNDWMAGCVPLVMAWAWLAAAVLFLGLAALAHQSRAWGIGVMAAVLSAGNFVTLAIRRRRARMR